MSLLICGMEMPTSCLECPLTDEHSASCLITEQSVYFFVDKRHNDCPLIPVPPHGRLIDADALRQSLKESIDECHKWADEVEGGEMYARVSQSLGTFVECSMRVKAAPTIIPASGGKEDE